MSIWKTFFGGSGIGGSNGIFETQAQRDAKASRERMLKKQAAKKEKQRKEKQQKKEAEQRQMLDAELDRMMGRGPKQKEQELPRLNRGSMGGGAQNSRLPKGNQTGGSTSATSLRGGNSRWTMPSGGDSQSQSTMPSKLKRGF